MIVTASILHIHATFYIMSYLPMEWLYSFKYFSYGLGFVLCKQTMEYSWNTEVVAVKVDLDFLVYWEWRFSLIQFQHKIAKWNGEDVMRLRKNQPSGTYWEDYSFLLLPTDPWFLARRKYFPFVVLVLEKI